MDISASTEPKRPHHVHRGMSNYRSQQLAMGAPCSAVEHSRDAGQQHVAPIKNGSLVEMRQAKKQRGTEKRRALSEAGLQQILQNSAKKHLFGKRDQEQRNQNTSYNAQCRWQSRIEVDESKRKPQPNTERQEVDPLAQ